MRAAAMLVLAGLAACRQEPDFEERYASASEDIQAKAAEIDAQLDEGLGGQDDEPAAEATAD